MRYFAITLASAVAFAVFGAVLMAANQRYVEYYVQYDGPPHNPFRNTLLDGYDHSAIQPFAWNRTAVPNDNHTLLEQLRAEWTEDVQFPGHFYSYQPCQLPTVDSGDGLAGSHAAHVRCHVAVVVTREMAVPGSGTKIALNYRLSNFYYSMLEFALSWNPLQLMAEPGFFYQPQPTPSPGAGLPDTLAAVASAVQSSTADGSCANAALDNTTGLLLEPCGLRAAAMFNDRFRLTNYSGTEALALDETNIAWATDGDVVVNSPAFEAGLYSPHVAYLHQQQPHIVAPGEGVANEHFRVWMHSEAFPAFNKRYATVTGGLVQGTVLVFEVDAHYPTMQFGGSKYIQLQSVDALQVKNRFTPYVFLAMAGVCLVLAVFILVEKLACARPRGRAKFNKDWYNKSLQAYEEAHARRTATFRPSDDLVEMLNAAGDSDNEPEPEPEPQPEGDSKSDGGGAGGGSGGGSASRNKPQRGGKYNKVAPLSAVVTGEGGGGDDDAAQ